MAKTLQQQAYESGRGHLFESYNSGKMSEADLRAKLSGGGGGGGGGVNVEQALQAQRQRNKDFLGRYTTGLSGAIKGIEQELNLPGLRQGTQGAIQSAQNVAGQVRAIPGTQQTIAKQVGISAPRLAQRTAAETAKLTPALEAAQRGLETATGAQQFAETEFGRRIGQEMKPFEIEAGLMGQEVASQFDMLKTQVTNDLNRELAQLSAQTQLSVADMNRLTRMAELEQATQQGSFQDFGNRVALINPVTGQEISSFAKGLSPTKGTTPVNTDQYYGGSGSTDTPQSSPRFSPYGMSTEQGPVYFK